MLLLRVHVGVHIVIQLQILAKVIGFIKSNWIKSLLFNNFTISYLVGVHSSEDFLVYFTLYWFFTQTSHQDVAYIGSLTDFDGLLRWAQQSCVPLVREITFDNAEVSISAY